MFKYSDIQYTSLTPDNILNSLIYRTLFYVSVYGSYKLSKKQSGFLANPVHPIWDKKLMKFITDIISTTICVMDTTGF